MNETARKEVPESQVIKIFFESVTKRFRANKREILALNRVSFHISDGEFVSFVGPSGCGKSTVLKILAGLEDASEGRVLVSGREVREPGADRGMVFQSYTLFPWLSVRDNIEFGLKLKGMRAAERREISDRYLRLVSLEPFAEAYPKELSGGMKQRVAIARRLPTIRKCC